MFLCFIHKCIYTAHYCMIYIFWGQSHLCKSVKATDLSLLYSNMVLVVLPVLILCRFCLLKALHFKGAAWLGLGFLLLSLQTVEVWTVVVLPTKLVCTLQLWLLLLINVSISAGRHPTWVPCINDTFEIILDIKMQ